MPTDGYHNPWQLRRAAYVVRLGGIIAYPTESVFGLGCDPLNATAVQHLLALKRRSKNKGLILISDKFDRLLPYLEKIPHDRLERVKQSWPGPFTWIMPASKSTPTWLRGNHTTLAVRVTAHPMAAAICQAVGMPLVSTSANLSQHPPARTALEVRTRCGDTIDYILHGKTGGMQRPTQILNALTGEVLRR